MSLRTRLLLGVGAVALVALVAADFGIYASLRSFLFNQVDSSLRASHESVELLIASHGGHPGPGASGSGSPTSTPPGQPGAPRPGGSPTDDAFSSFCLAAFPLASGTFVEVRTATSTAVTGEVCAPQVAGHEYTPVLPKVITGFSREPLEADPTVYFTTTSVQPDGTRFRVQASRLPSGLELVLATPLSATDSTLDQLLLLEASVTAAALVIALLLGRWLVGIGLRPLRVVEGTADAIAAGDFELRVPNPAPNSEVGHVATALNVMLNRIGAAFDERDTVEADLRTSENRLRRFVADASHELRTPIAAVSAYAELVDTGPLPSGDLPRVLRGIRGETARMGRLVEDLLLLARLDEGLAIEREPVELAGLVIEAVATAKTVGPDWPIEIDIADTVEVRGDEGRLLQVIDNLLANVRAHTPAGTTTTVRVDASESEAMIEVADDGPGLTAEEAALAFDRFFRADPSRSRAAGGSGLGLSIVASIVAAHHGNVTAAPREGGGARFTVALPLLDPGELSDDPNEDPRIRD